MPTPLGHVAEDMVPTGKIGWLKHRADHIYWQAAEVLTTNATEKYCR